MFPFEKEGLLCKTHMGIYLRLLKLYKLLLQAQTLYLRQNISTEHKSIEMSLKSWSPCITDHVMNIWSCCCSTCLKHPSELTKKKNELSIAVNIGLVTWDGNDGKSISLPKKHAMSIPFLPGQSII